MPAPSPISQMPGHLIRRLHQYASAQFQTRVKAAGFDITPVQFAALSSLATQPGLDQASLAGLIEYDRATIGGVVRRMVQKGWIQRQPNTSDRRAFQLYLTASGQEFLAKVTPVVDRVQTDILCDLTSEEQATLKRLIRKALQLDKLHKP